MNEAEKRKEGAAVAAEHTKAEQNMLALLRAAFTGGPLPEIGDWDAVLTEMKNHGVHLLPAESVQKLPLTDRQKNEYDAAMALSFRTFHSVLLAQQEVTELLDNAGIPFIVLKGAAAAINYPHPEYRCMGDIDILVLPDDYDRTFQLLCENEYKNEQPLKDEYRYRRHIGFRNPQGIEIELHRFFSSSGNEQQDRFLDQKLFEGIKRRIRRPLGGYEVSMLPDFENGLVLLGHINQHLGSGLGLRQIFDWMFFVKAYLDDARWADGFEAAAEAIGMRTLAITVTAMAQDAFGLCPDITWCSGADRQTAEDLLDYILMNGNFGRKKEQGSRDTLTVMKHFHNPVSAFRYLHAGGMVHWQAARKHRFLRPFAWIYQIGHILRMGLQRRKHIGTFVGEWKQNGQETDLLQRLGITRL